MTEKLFMTPASEWRVLYSIRNELQNCESLTIKINVQAKVLGYTITGWLVLEYQAAQKIISHKKEKD